MDRVTKVIAIKMMLVMIPYGEDVIKMIDIKSDITKMVGWVPVQRGSLCG